MIYHRQESKYNCLLIFIEKIDITSISFDISIHGKVNYHDIYFSKILRFFDISTYRSSLNWMRQYQNCLEIRYAPFLELWRLLSFIQVARFFKIPYGAGNGVMFLTLFENRCCVFSTTFHYVLFALKPFSLQVRIQNFQHIVYNVQDIEEDEHLMLRFKYYSFFDLKPAVSFHFYLMLYF